jgi:hypothetical protein
MDADEHARACRTKIAHCFVVQLPMFLWTGQAFAQLASCMHSTPRFQINLLAVRGEVQATTLLYSAQNAVSSSLSTPPVPCMPHEST